MPVTKLGKAMEKYGETDKTLARKTGYSSVTISRWRAGGVTKKCHAYAIAYAMDCNHKEILEDKAHREGWDLTPCLPGFDL